MIVADTQPHSPVPTVAVAADRPQDAQRVQAVLRSAGGCEVRAGDDLGRRRAGDGAPDVTVLWRRAPASALAEELRGLAAGSDAVVAVVADADRSALRRLLRAGADGLVLEGEVDATLAAAVAAVAGGLLVLPRAFRPPVDREPLSHREKQVLGMVVAGCTNRQIADKLFLAESTVKTHLSSAFAKLNTRSRAEAAALVLDPDEGLGGILALSPVEAGPA